MILHKAWKTKIEVRNRIFFDHDYPTEVIRKRRSYIGIKRALKEGGIRFQTPLTKIRIHKRDRIKTYESASEAAWDMRERGYTISPPEDDSAPATEGERRGTQERQRARRKDKKRGGSTSGQREASGVSHSDIKNLKMSYHKRTYSKI